MTIEGAACKECPDGILVSVCAPGRFRRYRGRYGYAVPRDMPIPTCSACGAWHLDRKTARKLSALFESQRSAADVEVDNDYAFYSTCCFVALVVGLSVLMVIVFAR